MSFFDRVDMLVRVMVTFIFLSSVCLLLMNYVKKRLRHFPPGPWGWPIVGSLLKHTGSPISWYTELCERYGDLVSVQLGRNLVVLIGSASLLRELFCKADSTDRPDTPLNNLMDGRGIILSEGLLWRKQRQFLHEIFRKMGIKMFGDNKKIDALVTMEVKDFFRILDKSESAPVDPSTLLARHIHNVITQILMSFRFEEDDPEFPQFYERINQGMKTFGSIHIGEHLPWFTKLPGKRAVLDQIAQNLHSVTEFHQKHLNSRREMLRNTDLSDYKPKDVLDYYLLEIMKNEPEPGTSGSGGTQPYNKLFHGVDPERQTLQIMNDLFSAGMETSRSTLVWMLIMMLREDDVRMRVRFDLEQVVEPGQMVTLEHRTQLPYVEAVMFETLRMVSVVPLATTHVNKYAWNVNGYLVPAKSHLVPLLTKINMDPELFPEPRKFTPERFVQDGKILLPDVFMPFGVGRRMCLGDQLARIELFLIFANLMNNYEFELPEGHVMPDLVGTLGTIHVPNPFTLSFRRIDPGYRSSQHG